MVTFTPALPEDADALFSLNRDLIAQYEDLSAIDHERVLLWVRRNIQENIPHFSRILFDGELAGYFCLTGSEDTWELDSLFVLPPFQHRGIGTAVLRHCQKVYPSLLLYVFRANCGAIRLYEKMGFSITKEVGKTRYIMQWKT